MRTILLVLLVAATVFVCSGASPWACLGQSGTPNSEPSGKPATGELPLPSQPWGGLPAVTPPAAAPPAQAEPIRLTIPGLRALLNTMDERGYDTDAMTWIITSNKIDYESPAPAKPKPLTLANPVEAIKAKAAGGHWEYRRQCGAGGCTQVPTWVPDK